MVYSTSMERGCCKLSKATSHSAAAVDLVASEVKAIVTLLEHAQRMHERTRTSDVRCQHWTEFAISSGCVLEREGIFEIFFRKDVRVQCAVSAVSGRSGDKLSARKRPSGRDPGSSAD